LENDKKLIRFKEFAFASTAITYFLIFVGGLVRVSGAGLGCPDWPKCFGRWIPPTNVSQLPPDIDPNLFNFTLAWIEYINRLIGMCTGLLIAITAILAIKNFRKYPKILYPSIAAALLVAFQGWQGGQVVASALEPFMITIHMLLAFLIVSIMLYVFLQAFFLKNPHMKGQGIGTAKIWVLVLYAVTIIQVVMGTQMRSGLEMLAENFPLLGPSEWIAKLGPVNQIHTILGILIIALAVYVTLKLYNSEAIKLDYFKTTVLSMDILVVLQLIIGFALIWIGLPPLLQIVHLWLSSLIIGALLIIHSSG